MGLNGQISPVAGRHGGRSDDPGRDDIGDDLLDIFVWEPFILYLVFGGLLVVVGLFKGSVLAILLGILIASTPPVTFIWRVLTTVGETRTNRPQQASPSYQADYYYQYPPQQPPPRPAPAAHASEQYGSPIMTSNWWDEWKRTPPRVNHNVQYCPDCKGRVFSGRAYCPHCSSPIPGAHVGGQSGQDVEWYE
jgi:hypothetical protein